jgi:hypothetical protein
MRPLLNGGRLGDSMQWRFAEAVDVPWLAQMNRHLIADEGHRNPMDRRARG